MIIPLSSTPRLKQVNTEVFELTYFGACMSCGFCKDSCCQYGADVNVEERDRILAHAESIRPFVKAPPERWFRTEEEVDAEYPGGRFVRTRVNKGACVFLNRSGRGCQLHAWAISTGRDYHDFKPLVCWMFPLIYDQGTLRASIDVHDGLVCVGKGPSLYESARSELQRFFGEPLVQELDAVQRSLASGQPRNG